MSDIKDLSDTEDVLRDLENVDDSQRTAIRNNGGGFYNHSVFWSVMCPGGREMSADMKDLIIQHFGSVDDFCEHFAAAATGQFGSGWAWLIATDDGLAITSTANQDNPLMPYADQQGYPLLGLDVREHAYYLHYQNRRADYVSAWMETINRSAVEERYASVS
jgi:Fe-Mn family superoxide dismutase